MLEITIRAYVTAGWPGLLLIQAEQRKGDQIYTRQLAVGEPWPPLPQLMSAVVEELDALYGPLL